MGRRVMSRPRRYRLDFRDLMAQCEWNYARLLPLMRALGDDDSLDVSLGEERPRTVSIGFWSGRRTPPPCVSRIRPCTTPCRRPG